MSCFFLALIHLLQPPSGPKHHQEYASPSACIKRHSFGQHALKHSMETQFFNRSHPGQPYALADLIYVLGLV